MTPIWKRELTAEEDQRLRALIAEKVLEGRRSEEDIDWRHFRVDLAPSDFGLRVDVFDHTTKSFILTWFPEKERAEQERAEQERTGDKDATDEVTKKRVSREIRSTWAVEEAK